MKLRVLSTLVVAAVAVTGLSGCDSKVGLAAEANGVRISDSDLSPYVNRSGPTADVLAQATAPVEPRVQVLRALIQQEAVEHALRETGGVPSDPKLDGFFAEATQRFLGNANNDPGFNDLLEKQLTQYGFTQKFGELLIRNAELNDAMVNRVKAANQTALYAAINKYPIEVSVSRRWGTWERKILDLTTANDAGLPGFISFAKDTSAADTLPTAP